MPSNDKAMLTHRSLNDSDEHTPPSFKVSMKKTMQQRPLSTRSAVYKALDGNNPRNFNFIEDNPSFMNNDNFMLDSNNDKKRNNNNNNDNKGNGNLLHPPFTIRSRGRRASMSNSDVSSSHGKPKSVHSADANPHSHQTQLETHHSHGLYPIKHSKQTGFFIFI